MHEAAAVAAVGGGALLLSPDNIVKHRRCFLPPDWANLRIGLNTGASVEWRKKTTQGCGA